MHAAIGAGFLAAAVVMFAWAYGQYRRPHPARWTLSEWLSVSLTLSMIFLLTSGLGTIVKALLNTQSMAMGAFDVAIVVGALVLAFALVPSLTKAARVPKTGAAVVAAGAATVVELPQSANDPGPTTPARPFGAGGKSGRFRRAA